MSGPYKLACRGKKKPQPPHPWPRLSHDLPCERHPQVCQACGQRCILGDESLERWREHDDADRPGRNIVVLCSACAKQWIEPHPRLYSQLQQHAPHPGSMPLCVDCRHRNGLRCKHPDAKLNGGPGLNITAQGIGPVHITTSPRRNSGWYTLYSGPVRACSGREEA